MTPAVKEKLHACLADQLVRPAGSPRPGFAARRAAARARAEKLGLDVTQAESNVAAVATGG